LARTLLRLSLLVLCFAPSCFAQQTPAWEFFGGYSFERSYVRGYYRSTPIIYTFREDLINLHGWELAVTENVNQWFGGTFQATGHYSSPTVRGTKNKESMFSLLYGPRFSHRMGWASAYGHILLGAGKTSVTVSPGPHASEMAFQIAGGAGFDLNLGSRAAVRVLQVQYSPMNQVATKDHKFQASSGIVFRLGTKR
jgi:hypothetical protein